MKTEVNFEEMEGFYNDLLEVQKEHLPDCTIGSFLIGFLNYVSLKSLVISLLVYVAIFHHSFSIIRRIYKPHVLLSKLKKIVKKNKYADKTVAIAINLFFIVILLFGFCLIGHAVCRSFGLYKRSGEI